ncbi:hypothetical protein B0H13DRAFT_1888518 [Mycena leptocephala]|nr:hypothetical protein B0H13DRAFT_1888518 [Mycena leptocephala]
MNVGWERNVIARLFEKITEEMKSKPEATSETVSARKTYNQSPMRFVPRKISLNDWLRTGLKLSQPPPMQSLLTLPSAVIFVAMSDLINYLLAQQAAREAAFHAFKHSLQERQGGFLGPIHVTCDSWDVDSDELPDFVDWDA